MELSKPRYKWWGYIRRVLCDYPRMRNELDALKAPMQSAGEQVCRGSGVGRPVELLGTVTLPDVQEQKELEAVEQTLMVLTGEEYRLVEMVFFKQTHTLYGASKRLNISYELAKRRQRSVICETAKNLGLLKV